MGGKQIIDSQRARVLAMLLPWISDAQLQDLLEWYMEHTDETEVTRREGRRIVMRYCSVNEELRAWVQDRWPAEYMEAWLEADTGR